jgi:prepilin-type N-terminal cleavage/methylation domain-containing protein
MRDLPAEQGFTLVELMVSVGIFSLITTIAIFSNSRFNSTVVLTNLAYEVALSVRQAQFYGITVKRSAAGAFDSGYGVHFDAATPDTYILFEDKVPQNHRYDNGEAVETYTLKKGNGIGKICVDSNCANSSVDITFIRPNPDATSFYVRSAGGTGTGGTAEICVASPQGDKRKVIVESTGQISVQPDDSGVCN